VADIASESLPADSRGNVYVAQEAVYSTESRYQRLGAVILDRLVTNPVTGRIVDLIGGLTYALDMKFGRGKHD
jgi:hypothetical protein